MGGSTMFDVSIFCTRTAAYVISTPYIAIDGARADSTIELMVIVPLTQKHKETLSEVNTDGQRPSSTWLGLSVRLQHP